MRFTERQNGHRMTTVTLTVHLYQEEVDWVAERLSCSRQAAVRQMVSQLASHGIGEGLRTWAICGSSTGPWLDFPTEETAQEDPATYPEVYGGPVAWVGPTRRKRRRA